MSDVWTNTTDADLLKDVGDVLACLEGDDFHLHAEAAVLREVTRRWQAALAAAKEPPILIRTTSKRKGFKWRA